MATDEPSIDTATPAMVQLVNNGVIEPTLLVSVTYNVS